MEIFSLLFWSPSFCGYNYGFVYISHAGFDGYFFMFERQEGEDRKSPLSEYLIIIKHYTK